MIVPKPYHPQPPAGSYGDRQTTEKVQYQTDPPGISGPEASGDDDADPHGVTEEYPRTTEEATSSPPASLEVSAQLSCNSEYLAMCEAIGTIIAQVPLALSHRDVYRTLLQCHLLHDPAPYVTSCKTEVCSRDLSHAGAASVACRRAEDYSDACRGLAVCEEWRGRSPLSCPPSPCPAHSHYEECGPGCERTCAEPVCREEARPGCYCDQGHVMEGGRCRGEADCLTCTVANTTRHNHHTWREDTCTACTCQGNNTVTNIIIRSLQRIILALYPCNMYLF